MEEQRSKRAKATPADLAEPSSSRAPNVDSEINGEVPLSLPHGNPSSRNEEPAEVDHLSQRNPNISTPVVSHYSVVIAQSSGHGVSVSTDSSSERNVGLEEPREPSADSIADPPLHRNSSRAAIGEHGEASTEPEMVINTPLQRNPSTAAMDEQGEATVAADMAIDMPTQRNSSSAAIDEHGGVFVEPVLVEAVAVEPVPSSQVGAPTVAAEGAGHGTDDIIARNDVNSLKSLFNAGEEDAQVGADCINCPICMEPWTGEGIHRICCLACGHLFGRSCIRRWLINQRGKKNGKCPHCNRKARVEDIRNLYVPSLTVIDDRSQQLLEELGVLRSKNEELVMKNDKLKREYERLQAVLAASHPPDIPGVSSRVDRGKSHKHHTVEENWPSRPFIYSNDQARSKENFFMKRSSNLRECTRRESFAARNQMRSHNSLHGCGRDIYKTQQVPKFSGNESPVQFQLQEEFSLPGARVFDMDAFSQMVLVAQKPSAMGGSFCLNKLSLLSLSDAVVMPLPQCTGAVRDIRVAPPGGKLPGRLALVASLGKMISLFSLESNNVVLTYKLESPCWSCAWDPNEPNYVFAGLQDGAFTIFDLRQTSSHLRSVQSFCRQPIHTLHPVNECNVPEGFRRNGILSACSSGVRFWESTVLDLHDSRPHTIPCADNQGICVALAYNQLASVAVATFREKPYVHQPEAPSYASQVESVEPGGISSQFSLGSRPLRAAHYPLVKSASASLAGHEARHASDSVHTSSSTANVLPSEDMSSTSCGWQYGNPTFGNVSPVGMHRSSIVCSLGPGSSSDSQSVFAFGDEETRALMLWDVKTLTLVDCLKAHSSPILDVRSMNVGEHSVLGCTSSTTLQVYKR